MEQLALSAWEVVIYRSPGCGRDRQDLLEGRALNRLVPPSRWLSDHPDPHSLGSICQEPPDVVPAHGALWCPMRHPASAGSFAGKSLKRTNSSRWRPRRRNRLGGRVVGEYLFQTLAGNHRNIRRRSGRPDGAGTGEGARPAARDRLFLAAFRVIGVGDRSFLPSRTRARVEGRPATRPVLRPSRWTWPPRRFPDPHRRRGEYRWSCAVSRAWLTRLSTSVGTPRPSPAS